MLLIRRTLVVASVLLGSVVLTLAPAAAVEHPGRPGLTTVHHLVAASIRLNRDPAGLATSLPTVRGAAGALETGVSRTCFGASAAVHVPVGAIERCAVGDVKVSRTILLFGDGQAESWLPAFDQIGRDLHFRVVLLGRSRCSPWALAAHTNARGCRKFDRVVVAWARRNHVAVVVPVGDKLVWRGSLGATVSNLKDQMISTVDALRAGGSRVVLLSPSPEYLGSLSKFSPERCLLHESHYLGGCERTSFVFTERSASALAIAATAHRLGVPFVNTRPLFCAAGKCALYVRTSGLVRLVYANRHQINRYYSVWISFALEQMLRGDL